ncbi:uncharacterized protein N7458_004167 [Penicillium daleae]|uniref:Uncharacterized protein n=1 Tax=Penicillium daleae TaxID=63821 RepID=A0AAD6G5K6_9EURO|nr:uncharacterized protein N7458_004167 [Penicillium daleae]KAJ5455903.1 hypothetical protein N7458_004167 [Penicillium daleae]
MVENKDKLLRPPFSLRLPTPENPSDHVRRDSTTNGPPSTPTNSAGCVPQEPIQNGAVTPPLAYPTDSNTNDHESPLAGDFQPQLKSTPKAASSSALLVNLPTISRNKDHHVFSVADDVDAYLERDLDHSRLNRIHGHLWMAGRPLNARPIHRQKMMGFDIILTEQADLHLLKFSNKIFVKPLPNYMLDFLFWETYLCKSEDLHKSACGILLSYVWLICSPLDLKLAHKLDLLPSEITWLWWKSFVAEFILHNDPNTLDKVNKRYHFGELRLGRINSIYRIRFFFTHFIRGYLYGYNRYVVFFQRNFAWILIVLVYFSLVLTAMQVGATIPPLNTNTAFLQASYGFSVFSIITVAAIVGSLGVMFVTIFLINMFLAIRQEQKQRRDRELLAQKKEKGIAKA